MLSQAIHETLDIPTLDVPSRGVIMYRQEPKPLEIFLQFIER